MTIEKIGFSYSHIPDNEAAYFSLIEGVVNSVDQYSIMAIRRHPQKYYIKISPSSAQNINLIIQALVQMNKYIGILLNFSKSVKSSSSISFTIDNFTAN